jgi:hypothetical protein
MYTEKKVKGYYLTAKQATLTKNGREKWLRVYGLNWRDFLSSKP